jgi:exosortase A
MIDKSMVRWWPYVFMVSLVSVFIWDAFSNMVVLWVTTDTYMHGAFVIPLSLLMISRMQSPGTMPKPISPLLIFCLSVMWVSLLLVSKLSMINTLQQFALLLTVPLVTLAIYGWRITWHYRTPIILMFLAVPFGDFLVPLLQSITADMSVYLLQLSSVPVLRNGWYISIAAADFRVAEACSGINFLISTITVSIFYAFSYMTKVTKRCVFILMGVVVPLVANGVRVYLIIMIAYMGDVEAATGFDHLIYGWVFFAIVLLIMFGIGHYFQDPYRVIVKFRLTYEPKETIGRAKKHLAIMFSVLLVSLSWTLWQYERVNDTNYYTIGNNVEKGDILSPKFPASDGVSRFDYSKSWTQYYAYYNSESINKKLISYNNRWFDENIWSIESESVVFVYDEFVTRYVLADLSGRRFQLLVGYCVGGEWSANTMMVKALQIKSKIIGRDFGGAAVAWFASADMKLPEWSMKTNTNCLD